MKIALLAFALLGVAVADVSHLKNVYLPPVPAVVAHTQHVSHIQKSQDVFQAPVQEVVDNYVTETVTPQEEQGQVVVETAQYDNGAQDHSHVAGVVAQHVVNIADISHQVQSYAQQAPIPVVATVEPAAPASNVYQQQTTYYTQQQQVDQHQQQEPQYYYTSAVVQQQVPAQQQYQTIASHVEHNAAVAAPVIQTYTQQQNTGYYGQQSASVGSSASAGTGTQYAANGGYVY